MYVIYAKCISILFRFFLHNVKRTPNLSECLYLHGFRQKIKDILTRKLTFIYIHNLSECLFSRNSICIKSRKRLSRVKNTRLI